MTVSKDSAIIVVLCKHSVDASVDRPRMVRRVKGATLFALGEHRDEAEKACLR